MSVTYTSAIADFIQKLEAGNPLPPLVPQQESCAELTQSLQAVSTDVLFDGQKVKDTTFADAIKSGLLLWNDALDASHTISQELANATGSYWHGLMHRREPDYSNAKYWFGRVGTHAISPKSAPAPSRFTTRHPHPRPRSPASGKPSRTTRHGTRLSLLTGVRPPKARQIPMSLNSCNACRWKRCGCYWRILIGMPYKEPLRSVGPECL